MKTAAKDENRFETDANRYARYLGTPEGRLRADLALTNLEEFLPAPSGVDSLRALDLGCGTGSAGVRLARLGIHVTLLDSSKSMLDLAERTVAEAALSHQIEIKNADAAQCAVIFEPQSFDVILCHNLLEYVDDPALVLRGAVRLMRNSSAILSVLVRNQAGEVMKAVLQAGDLAAGEYNLTATSATESLYGGNVRLFTSQALDRLLNRACLTINARRGVRVIADYLPAQISRSAEYDQIFGLEQKVGKRREFFGVARYMQCLARRATPASGGEE